MFAVGGLLGFLVLDVLLQLSGSGGSEDPQTAFPFAGTLNFLSVLAGLGVTDLLAHLVHSSFAWLLAPLAATAAYLAIVALQVAGVGAVPRALRGLTTPGADRRLCRPPSQPWSSSPRCSV